MRSERWPWGSHGTTGYLIRLVVAGVAGVMALGFAPGLAQESPGDPSASALGSSPGSTGAIGGGGSGVSVIPVGPGPSYPRVPMGITQPSESFGPGSGSGLGLESISLIPETELPALGVLAIAGQDELDVAPGGITIDQAIDRLVSLNLELRAQAYEIPKGRADVLTAGLRSNPLLYVDSVMVPYGSFRDTAGGPTQYDINVTLPLDVNNKRKRRVEAATRALQVTEAQFQDSVRTQLDNLYTAWIDVLAARAAIRALEAGVRSLGEQKEMAEQLAQGGKLSQTEVNNIEIQRDSTDVALLEARETYDDAKRTLAALMNLPLAEAESFLISGSLRGLDQPAPPVEQLIQQALAIRPDLAAFRIGVRRAQSEERLARANRLEDIFVVYQPASMQEGLKPGDRMATSWAAGVTIPLPIFNRNQGNIARARHTIVQTQTQLENLQRQVILEVQRAEAAYGVTLAKTARLRDEILPAARDNLERSLREADPEQPNPLSRFEAQRSFAEVSRQYLEALVRHRRSMFRINTAVGIRVFP